MNDAMTTLESDLVRKRAQLMDYMLSLVDREDAVGKHAFTIADGRVMQIDQDIAALRRIRCVHIK